MRYKIIGAEVGSSEAVAKRGMIAFGAPSEKRFGLMMVSACAANLLFTSDAFLSSLVGSWISALLYQRPMMVHLNKLSQVIPTRELNPEEPVLRAISRGTAEEILVLSCQAPLAASDIVALFSDRFCSSDASTEKEVWFHLRVVPICP